MLYWMRMEKSNNSSLADVSKSIEKYHKAVTDENVEQFVCMYRTCIALQDKIYFQKVAQLFQSFL